MYENNTHKERRINRGTDLVNNLMGLELEYIFATKAARKVLEPLESYMHQNVCLPLLI